MKWDNLGSTLLRHSVAVSASNLRGKMDARKQGRPDMPLNEQLAHLRALGMEQ